MKRRPIAIILRTLLALLVAPVGAEAQLETLARAKDYYAAASYDEALQVLDQLRHRTPTTGMTEVAAYQMFCLVALGRNQEATTAIEALVKLDPLYHPSEADASPRVRTFFENTRKPLLPAIVRQMYGQAKSRMDRKEFAEASEDFDRVLALLDEMGTSGDQGVADLRTLASGFRDLSKASTPPPPPPAPAAMPVEEPKPVAPAPDTTIYTGANTDVVPPVALKRTMPPWQPVKPIDKIRNFRGAVELVIDERGKVQTVIVAASVHQDYDAALARAARDWTFQPAMKAGAAVRYRMKMEITLTPPSGR